MNIIFNQLEHIVSNIICQNIQNMSSRIILQKTFKLLHTQSGKLVWKQKKIFLFLSF